VRFAECAPSLQPLAGASRSSDAASSGRLRSTSRRSEAPPPGDGAVWRLGCQRSAAAIRDRDHRLALAENWVPRRQLSAEASGLRMPRLPQRSAGQLAETKLAETKLAEEGEGAHESAALPEEEPRGRRPSARSVLGLERSRRIPRRDAGNAAADTVVQPASERTRWTSSLRSSWTRSMSATNRASPWS
jgi:hypothetical protein